MTSRPSSIGKPAAVPGTGSQVSRGAPGASRLLVRRLGLVDYVQIWEAMKAFTASRTETTPDELWVLQHTPVYTYGVAGRSEHLPRSDGGIPVLKVDRGGQITYHGPGQIVVYTLLDLRRRNLTVRELVQALEQAVLDLLEEHGVAAQRKAGAPGVYVGEEKIAALGLRVSRGRSYHGLSLNVDCDLAPFRNIDPCGFPGLAVTRTADLGIGAPAELLAERLVEKVAQQLGTQA